MPQHLQRTESDAHPPDRKKKPAERTNRSAGFFAGASRDAFVGRDANSKVLKDFHAWTRVVKRRQGLNPVLCKSRADGVAAARHAFGIAAWHRKLLAGTRLTRTAKIFFGKRFRASDAIVQHVNGASTIGSRHNRADRRRIPRTALAGGPCCHALPPRLERRTSGQDSRQRDRDLLIIRAARDPFAHPPALRKDAQRAHAARHP